MTATKYVIDWKGEDAQAYSHYPHWQHAHLSKIPQGFTFKTLAAAKDHLHSEWGSEHEDLRTDINRAKINALNVGDEIVLMWWRFRILETSECISPTGN